MVCRLKCGILGEFLVVVGRNWVVIRMLFDLRIVYVMCWCVMWLGVSVMVLLIVIIM